MHAVEQLAGGRLLTWKNVAILAILGVFVSLGIHRALQEDGDDLSASYIACRLLATGNAAHLYSHDPENFSAIGPDAAWQQAADQGRYEAFLHPYVQTPLWAWSLQPLCIGPDSRFAFFQATFAVAVLLSFAASIVLIATCWAPELLQPIPIAVIALCLWFFEPFQYALALMQTHVLYFLLTLAALILAERRRPISAGVLLALAAAVKITPAALVLYWLLTRRWKAAASMAVTSALLWGAAYLAVGRQIMSAYLADLSRVSHVLLVSQNNQSFAAWAMAHLYPRKEILSFQAHAVPPALSLACNVLLLACTVTGGLLDRRRALDHLSPAPLGAMIALVGATIFAPIAWSHYSIILLAPLMLLARQQILLLRRPASHAPQHPALLCVVRRYWIAALLVVIFALNVQPFAAGAVETTIHRLTLVRSHFYAEILCLLTLFVVAWFESRNQRRPEAAAYEPAREQVYS